MKKFGIENVKGIDTSMSSSCKLDEDIKNKIVDSKLYQGMIGSLIYFIISRPDIYV